MLCFPSLYPRTLDSGGKGRRNPMLKHSGLLLSNCCLDPYPLLVPRYWPMDDEFEFCCIREDWGISICEIAIGETILLNPSNWTSVTRSQWFETRSRLSPSPSPYPEGMSRPSVACSCFHLASVTWKQKIRVLKKIDGRGGWVIGEKERGRKWYFGLFQIMEKNC